MEKAITIEAGQFGPRAVVHSAWSDSIVKSMKRAGVVELELNISKGWHGSDLKFLAQLPFLLKFSIFHFGIPDIAPIHHLSNLRSINITTYCSTKIEFAAFPELEDCFLEWRPGAESMFRSTKLKSLGVNRYKGENLADFGILENLESLSILNSSLSSLTGLAQLRKLKQVRLAGLRKLCSLAEIGSLANLEELEVHSCRKVTSIEEVRELYSLRKLMLINDGNIDSLRPIVNLRKLEWVLFYDSTNIVDGDLSPLTGRSALTRVSFMNRRHYSHRREDFGKAYTG